MISIESSIQTAAAAVRLCIQCADEHPRWIERQGRSFRKGARNSCAAPLLMKHSLLQDSLWTHTRRNVEKKMCFCRLRRASRFRRRNATLRRRSNSPLSRCVEITHTMTPKGLVLGFSSLSRACLSKWPHCQSSHQGSVEIWLQRGFLSVLDRQWPSRRLTRGSSTPRLHC